MEIEELSSISETSEYEEEEEDVEEEQEDIIIEEQEEQDEEQQGGNGSSSKIKRIQYSLWSAEDIFRAAVCVVSEPSYEQIFNSVHDPRMGPLDYNTPCSTCLNSFKNCQGHIGVIDLREFPVIHPLLVKEVKTILNCICHRCSSLLLTPQEIEYLHHNTTGINWTNIPCPQCNERNNETFVLKNDLLHVENHYTKRITRASTSKVLDILKKVPKDQEILGFKQVENLVITALPVIPNIFRLPILLYGSFTQHDFSKCYCDIVRDLKSGNADHQRIQQSIRVLFDAGKSISTNRKMLGIKQRIQAKKGTIRKSLLGKRVDFCGRTVLRPNPEISLEEIEIPSVMSKAFTKKPEKITIENWEEYLKAWSNGKAWVLENDLLVPAPDLHAKRSLQNGDYILMNRQPTLHKQGIMAHKVVLGNTNTIGLHLSVTTPYNADFDGDEGNLHFPQLVDSKFIEKMAVKRYILSDHTKEPLISVVYDGISGTYLLSYLNNDQLLYPLKGKKGVTKKDIQQAVKKIYLEHGEDEAVEFINETSRRAIQFLEKERILSAPYKHILALRPPKEIIEKQIQDKLQIARDNTGNEMKAIQALDLFDTDLSSETIDNDFVTMVKSGAKGTSFHLSQLTKFLGQQYIGGQRFQVDPETGRTNPFADFHSGDDPIHKGFVKHSFFDGLSNEELFFHSCGGREGLVDTAIKTAEIGALHRNLSKSLEDLLYDFDSKIVYTSSGSIISWIH